MNVPFTRLLCKAATPTFQVSAFLHTTTPPSENKQETIHEFEDTSFLPSKNQSKHLISSYQCILIQFLS